MAQGAMRVDGSIWTTPAFLQCAVTFIAANLTEPLSTSDIAAASGVSRRTIQVAFKTHYGSTVMGFVRRCRLERAHRELLAANAVATNVTTIALMSGFEHLSRFSSAYRQRFGEYPSETLRRRPSAGRPTFSGPEKTIYATRQRMSGSGYPLS